MAKSKIIKELANNEITLEVGLNRLLIIASDIDNEQLIEWVEKELNGYKKEDTIPPYRVVKNYTFEYSGINGGFKIKNAPLPLELIIGDKKGEMLHLNICDGIKTIEEYLSDTSRTSFGRDLTFLADLVYMSSGIQCMSIKQKVPSSTYGDVANSVKTILLKVLIELDKEYGVLDNLDIDTTDKSPEQINQTNAIINNYIYTDNSVTIGDKNKIKDTSIGG